MKTRFQEQPGVMKDGFPFPVGRACPQRAAPSDSKSSGFTLLELLLAVAVFAIVLAALNTVFYGAMRLRNKTTGALAVVMPREQALQVIRHDLANLVKPGGTLFGPLQTSPTSSSSVGTGTGTGTGLGGGGLGSGLGNQVAAGLGGSEQVSPDFYTSDGQLESSVPWGDVERVSYWLGNSTNLNNGKDLFRSVSRNLLSTIDAQPQVQRLLGGVQAMAFTYYDGTQWLDSWDSSTAATNLPFAIRVQIQLASQDQSGTLASSPQNLPVIDLVVPVDVQAWTNSTEGASSGSTGQSGSGSSPTGGGSAQPGGGGPPNSGGSPPAASNRTPL